MYDKNLISFCIPTYNRAEILQECLLSLIDNIKEHGFNIIISDNNSADNTAHIVQDCVQDYPNIKYYKQNFTLDADEHFSKVLSYTESKYTWLIGDSYSINKVELETLLGVISNKNYDMIFVNAFDNIKNTDSKVYTDLSTVLKEIGWHLPLMSAYIYSKEILLKANYKKFFYSSFIQMGIVFDYFENRDFEFYWHNGNSLSVTKRYKSSWQSQVMEVFIYRWPEFIFALPRQIGINVKLKCIKDHGRGNKLFTLKNLLSYREKGGITYKECLKYKSYFKYVDIYSWLIVVLISLIPPSLLTFVKSGFITYKNKLTTK